MRTTKLLCRVVACVYDWKVALTAAACELSRNFTIAQSKPVSLESC